MLRSVPEKWSLTRRKETFHWCFPLRESRGQAHAYKPSRWCPRNRNHSMPHSLLLAARHANHWANRPKNGFIPFLIPVSQPAKDPGVFRHMTFIRCEAPWNSSKSIRSASCSAPQLEPTSTVSETCGDGKIAKDGWNGVNTGNPQGGKQPLDNHLGVICLELASPSGWKGKPPHFGGWPVLDTYPF